MATSAEEAPLFIKSFFADSVEDTLELARLELGPDALLLNERESRPESRHLGAFEVVFGLRRSAPFRAPVPPPPAIRDLRERIRDLRDALRRNRAAAQALARENSRWRGAIEEHLIASGVALPLASDIAADVQERMRRRTVVQIGRAGQTCSTSDLVAETSACIASRFEVAPEIGRVSAFIGAPGVGKTTVLVKLALTQGLVAGRKVRLISTDNRRIGGAAQFETYASILGVPCSVVESAPALAQAIDQTPDDTMVFIDTPGDSALAAEESGRDLLDFFRQRQEVDAHLILTASMREVDMRRTVNSFLGFMPAKLLFSRLDETETTGSILSEAARTGKPISFFSTGQLVPEHIAPATKDWIIGPLVRQLPQSIQVMA